MARKRVLASAASRTSRARDGRSPPRRCPRPGNSGSARRRRRTAKRTPSGSAGPGWTRRCGRGDAVPAGPVRPGDRRWSRVSRSDRCVSHVPPDGWGPVSVAPGQSAKARGTAGGGIPNLWSPPVSAGAWHGSTTALSLRPARSGEREKSMGEGFLSGGCGLAAVGWTRRPRVRRASRWGWCARPGRRVIRLYIPFSGPRSGSTGTKIELNRAAQLPPDEGAPKVVRGRAGSRRRAHHSGER